MADNEKNGEKPETTDNEASTSKPEATTSPGTDAAVEPGEEATAGESALANDGEAPALEADPTIAQPPSFAPADSGPSTIDDGDAIAVDGLQEGDEDALHSVGMFMAGDAERVDIDSVELPPELAEPSFREVSKNVISWVILVICVGVAVGGMYWVKSDPDKSIQVELMFRGGLERHKKAHIIEQRQKFAKEDQYAQNRYGKFRMVYSPPDAQVSVTLLKYVEKLEDFMVRHVRGGKDSRKKIEDRELQKLRLLTENLQENQFVKEHNIQNLPVTSRSNPKDKEDPSKPKHCTDDTGEYCTFVYKIKISKEKWRPREFIVFSEYSLEPPDLISCGSLDPEFATEEEKKNCFNEKQFQQLLFKNTGPSIYEVAWPGANLQPTPELFQEKFIRVMTDKLKCNMGPDDYARLREENPLKNFAQLMELPDDERWQRLAENGLLAHGPPGEKQWTLMEWKSSVAELRQPENIHLWHSALKIITECDCDVEGLKCWKLDETGQPIQPVPAPK